MRQLPVHALPNRSKNNRAQAHQKPRIGHTLACCGICKANEVGFLENRGSVLSADRQWLVYVGKAASLSFLQLLRETVTQHIGPSQFSHNVKSEDMLETEAQHEIPNFAEEHCSADDRQRFVQCYYAVVS